MEKMLSKFFKVHCNRVEKPLKNQKLTDLNLIHLSRTNVTRKPFGSEPLFVAICLQHSLYVNPLLVVSAYSLRINTTFKKDSSN